MLFPQQSMEDELNSAFINARKGLYWALSNIDTGKNRISKELISENKLIAQVKLIREIDGVRIEAKGFDNSSEVTVKLYRSDSFLEKEGYLKKPLPPDSTERKKKKL